MEIIKNSAIDAWKSALKMIKEHGRKVIDHDNRLSQELLNISIIINNPAEDITKPIDAMKELKKWVYPELEELEDVMFKKEASSFYYYTYGARIFNYANTKNQIDDFIIPLLKKDPNTRRAVVMIYHPVSDSKINIKESPGMLSIMFKIVDKKLNLTVVIRSNDMFIGWPANIYQIYLLQKYVTESIGIETGSITTISHSAHVFQEYDEEVEAILRKK
ncbi:hypothetical protein JW756_06195 [Candidatus Woesearchaeota archaeon]|nr:hypothetical protein [Candidatus Woesearchaeota archaeon]